MGMLAATALGQALAIGLTLLVHVLGGAALIYVLIRDSGEQVRDWWPGDDDGPPPEGPNTPDPRGGDGGLPMPGAEPSAVRLREPGQGIGDGYTRPARRPVHPERVPERPPAER